jgi:predicted nucleic acid-binding protein
MICTLDANAIIVWSSPSSDALQIGRLELLLENVGKAKGVIVLPTPAIAELLVLTDDATANWLGVLQKKSAIKIAPFDLKAAVECAMIHRLAMAKGNKRQGVKKGEAYQKIKVDRQIAAIAKLHQSDLLVTDDANLAIVAQSIGLRTSRLEELEAPASARQISLALTNDKK